MNILGLISSLTDPASRARILQYIPYFAERGESLTCKHFNPLRDADPPNWSYRLKKITGLNEWRSSDLLKSAGRVPLLFSQSGFDVIWQNRLIQPHHSFWEKRLKKPVIFDFDDAIWLNEGDKQVRNKIERSQMIFAGNEYLASFAGQYNRNVKTVPTVVDSNRLYPVPQDKGVFTIGWSGTKSNFRYLEMISKPMLDFIGSHKKARLVIVSSEAPAFLPSGNEQVVFRKWDAETENELINSFSVGIMPLADDEWAKGKCAYKLLQYLACGKPVIATPAGVNSKILDEADVGSAARSNEEWGKAHLQMKNEPGMMAEKGNNGRTLVMDKYSCAVWSDPIISYMKSIV